MCLKNQIINQAEDIINTLREGYIKQKLEDFELVRRQGYYNMLDPQAMKLTDLTEEDHRYIITHYEELMNKYPEIKTRVAERLKYITSANISRIIAVKGCKECIEIVSTKLDVTTDDLCDSCKKIATEIIDSYE